MLHAKSFQAGLHGVTNLPIDFANIKTTIYLIRSKVYETIFKNDT